MRRSSVVVPPSLSIGLPPGRRVGVKYYRYVTSIMWHYVRRGVVSCRRGLENEGLRVFLVGFSISALLIAVGSVGAVGQSSPSAGCAAPTISLQTPSVSGLSVSINGVAAWGSGCTGTAIQWSWGDGSTGAQWFPASHTYSSSGTYSVTATAQQSDGQTASASASVTVYPSTFGQQPLLEDWPVLLTVRGADTPYRHLERAAPE